MPKKRKIDRDHARVLTKQCEKIYGAAISMDTALERFLTRDNSIRKDVDRAIDKLYDAKEQLAALERNLPK